MRWAASASLVCLLGAGCGGEPEVRFLHHPILYGSPDNSAEHMAVVGLSFGGGACTGTLISRDVVLTAAHCVEGQSLGTYTVTFGYNLYQPDDTRGVSEAWVHPNYDNYYIERDIAMLRLSSEAPSGIVPIRHLPSNQAVSQADVGSNMELVGFGQTETGSAGVKLHADAGIDWVCTSSGGCSITGGWANQNTICQDQEPSGICFGDSGGPAIILRGGAEYVAGVASYVGDDWCQSYGCHTKVDAYAADINDFVGGVLGAFCTAAWECLSGNCVDGVCCQSTCPGECQACNLPGSAGTCATVPNGTPCPDADHCDGEETCLSGTCVQADPPDCDDANVCTADSCVPASGCVHTPVQDGLSCANNDVCDGEETCQSGACRPGTPLDCNDLNPCTEDGCDAGTGCWHQNLADGTSCGGGPCGPASCRTGTCELDDPSFCDDGDPCTDTSCDPSAGCLYLPTPEGTPCPDGNQCNGAETCSQGACQIAAPLDCDDRNPCTSDACDEILGCVHDQVDDGTACGSGNCGEAACRDGACLAGGKPVCNDHNPCTHDFCDEHGGCLNEPVVDGIRCNETGFCREGECSVDLDDIVIEGGCGCGAPDAAPASLLPLALFLLVAVRPVRRR